MIDPSTKTPSLILEYLPNKEFRAVYEKLTKEDIKRYILQILIGLSQAHSRGIIHRDIKPGNVLMNPDKTHLTIVDWGLADFYLPHKKFNCRVASRYFKSPELLLNNHYYDYSLDIWSTGCMLAGMVFEKEPFFKGADNDDQLVRIAKVLGIEDVDAYCAKFPNVQVPQYFTDKRQNWHKKPWDKFVTSTNEKLIDAHVFDLLK